MIDLIVAGGGPAGLVTAIHAARAGMETVLIERRGGPIDKACGEGLMPHTVAHLERLGIPLTGREFRGITYLDDRRRVEARFRAGTGLGVRRTLLSSALQDAAAGLGVRMIRADIGGLHQDDDSVYCNGFRARYLAAADGLHSPIRRSLGLDSPVRTRRRWGIRRHYRIEPWSDTVQVHWSPESEAYVTPVAEDCVGVAVLTSRQGEFDSHIREFASLAKLLGGAAGGRQRAAGPLRQRARHRQAGRVMLVGDAAGYVDALTGEGLGIAFAGAELVVDVIRAGAVQDYGRRWRAMSRRYRALTSGLLWASGVGPVRAAIVPAAHALPRAFGGMVNLLAY